MESPLNLFKQSLFMEAPEDESPADETPPDVAPDDSPPPDIDTDAGTETDDTPPDIQDDDVPPDDMDIMGDDNTEEQSEEDKQHEMRLDAKVSTVMNVNLYQRYLTLLNTINGQLSMIKNNGDMIYALSKDTSSTISALKKLDENVRMYMSNIFQEENYSKNLLFFNKCLNLLKLLNDSFDKSIRKGISGL